jgi:topoisomerase-4 subunit B
MGPNGPTVRTFIIDFLKSKLDNFLHKNPEIAEAIQKNFNLRKRKKRTFRNSETGERKSKKFLFTIKNFVTADSITTIRKPKERRNPDLHYRRFCIRIHHKIRDVETQAVFSLKGKPLNCYGLTKKVVYENEEFNLLQAALNIEESLEDLDTIR